MTHRLPQGSAVKNDILNMLERAASTFVEQFVVIFLAASPLLLATQRWEYALDCAGFAAAISVGTSVLTWAVPTLPTPLDLVLRVLKTFLQSFLGTVIAAGVTSVVNADWKAALAVAIPVSLTALVKGLASLGAPWSDGASLAPAPIPPADPADSVPLDTPTAIAA